MLALKIILFILGILSFIACITPFWIYIETKEKEFKSSDKGLVLTGLFFIILGISNISISYFL